MLGGLGAQGTLALSTVNVVPDRCVVATIKLVERRDELHARFE